LPECSAKKREHNPDEESKTGENQRNGRHALFCREMYPGR
jgi:hypothetical protein